MTPITVPRFAFALLVGALGLACVDSSLPPDDGGGFPPPTDPPTIDVLPPQWTAQPGMTMTFQATDPVSNAPLVWTAPPEVTVIDVQSHAITLGSGLPKGKFHLMVQSSADPKVVGTATIRVVPFNYSGTLGGPGGSALHEPLADVAVRRGTARGAAGSVFLALYDPAAGDNVLRVFDHGFTTQLDSLPDRHFNPAQRPRVAADAQGRAFWIEQYYDGNSAQRTRKLLRRDVDGTLDEFLWTPAVTGGLQLVVGTDLACDDEGALYFQVEDGISDLVVRFEDPFAAGTLPQVLGPVLGAGPQVQLAVDALGRLLVAVGAQLERWTIQPSGAVEVEFLADLGASPADLDADAYGRLFAMFETEIDVLDAQGQVVAKLHAASVGEPAKVPFEDLQGLGVDGGGNLRIADDPLVDDAQLGITSLRTFALDIQDL